MPSLKILRNVKALYLTSAISIPARTHLRCLSFFRGSETSSDASTNYHHNSRINYSARLGTAGLIVSGLGLAWYLNRSPEDQVTPLKVQLPKLSASSGDQKDKDDEKKVSVRERRYKDFSSIRFKGEPYMTPRDLLESVTLDKPRCKMWNILLSLM